MIKGLYARKHFTLGGKYIYYVRTSCTTEDSLYPCIITDMVWNGFAQLETITIYVYDLGTHINIPKERINKTESLGRYVL